MPRCLVGEHNYPGREIPPDLLGYRFLYFTMGQTYQDDPMRDRSYKNRHATPWLRIVTCGWPDPIRAGKTQSSPPSPPHPPPILLVFSFAWQPLTSTLSPNFHQWFSFFNHHACSRPHPQSVNKQKTVDKCLLTIVLPWKKSFHIIFRKAQWFWCQCAISLPL